MSDLQQQASQSQTVAAATITTQTPKDQTSLSAVTAEITQLQSEGLLTIQRADLVAADTDLDDLQNAMIQENTNLSNQQAGELEYQIADPKFLAQQAAALTEEKRRTEAANQIFQLTATFDKFQAEAAQVAQQQDQIKQDFKASLFNILQQQENVLKAKQPELQNSVSDPNLGRLARRDARQNLEDNQAQLKQIQGYLAGKSTPDLLSADFINSLDPQVIKPYADREELLAAQMDTTRMQMEQSAQNLDKQMTLYQTNFSPSQDDPTLMRARQILEYKSVAATNKMLFRR